MKGKYVYQGIKSSVITLPDADDEIVEYVKSLSDEEKSQRLKVEKDDENIDNDVEIKKEKNDGKSDESKQKEEDKQELKKVIKKEIEKIEVKKNLKKQSSLPEISIEKKPIEHIDNKLPNKDSSLNEPLPSSIKHVKSYKPPISTQKERLVSPIPKDLSSGIPKSPINIK